MMLYIYVFAFSVAQALENELIIRSELISVVVLTFSFCCVAYFVSNETAFLRYRRRYEMEFSLCVKALQHPRCENICFETISLNFQSRFTAAVGRRQVDFIRKSIRYPARTNNRLEV